MVQVIWNISYRLYRFLGPVIAWKFSMSPPVIAFLRLIVTISGNRFIVIRTKYGVRLKLRIADYLFGGYLHLGETNPSETRVIRQILRPGDVMLDVGAHMGWYTLSSSQIVGTKGRIFAFEPNPEVFRWLQENCMINNLKNVDLRPLAISDKNSQADFWVGDIDSLGSLKRKNASIQSKKAPHKIRVKTMTLDTLVKKEKLSNIRLIKIDVEGADLQVLKGAKEVLRKFLPFLMVEVYGLTWNIDKKRDSEIYSFLESEGYHPFEFTQSGLKPINVETSRPQLINVFFAKDAYELQKRHLLDLSA